MASILKSILMARSVWPVPVHPAELFRSWSEIQRSVTLKNWGFKNEEANNAIEANTTMYVVYRMPIPSIIGLFKIPDP